MQWLPNDRILHGSRGGLVLTDPKTHQSRPVLKVPPPEALGDPQFAADGHMLYFIRGSREADIWMVELKGERSR
jgi:hypothetical protein